MAKSASLTLSAAALCLLAACSSPPPPPVVAPPLPPEPAAEPAAPQPAVSGDQQFVDQALAGGAAAVEQGRMAREKGASRAVRAYGARLVADHTRANNRLLALAKRLKLAESMPAEAAGDQLASLSGADFDRQFVADQVKAHEDTIAAFEAEAKEGQDAGLRRFARASLPMLRHHLHEAQSLQRRLGG